MSDVPSAGSIPENTKFPPPIPFVPAEPAAASTPVTTTAAAAAIVPIRRAFICAPPFSRFMTQRSVAATRSRPQLDIGPRTGPAAETCGTAGNHVSESVLARMAHGLPRLTLGQNNRRRLAVGKSTHLFLTAVAFA